MTTLSQNDAIKILIKAVQLAQSKGSYTLNEASTIHQAVSVFINSEKEKEEEENINSDSTINSDNKVNNV